jgi:uncharacterized OB-fold protein
MTRVDPAEPATCRICGTEVKPIHAACPGCDAPREEALALDAPQDQVTEAVKESFPASDPPAY